MPRAHSFSSGGSSENGLASDSSNGVEAAQTITVQRGIITKRVSLDASSESIIYTIRCAFGLAPTQQFWLENDNEVYWPVDRHMPGGFYELRVAHRCTMLFCYASHPVQTACEVYSKTITSQDDFLAFLERCGWIEVEISGDNHLIDNYVDIYDDVVYHGVRRI